MRRLLGLTLLALATPVAASNCWQVTTGDERAFCRAIESKQKSHCASITNYDLRQTCFVRLGSPKSLCATVSPGFYRVLCESR